METMAAVEQPARETPTPRADWNTLDRAYVRKGRDWAIVYYCPTDLPCIVCRQATRLMVCFSPRAALPICGSCRGY